MERLIDMIACSSKLDGAIKADLYVHMQISMHICELQDTPTSG